ncbi:MAG TPA: hypothetical protein VN736_30675 [Candidatus Limnocylindrales bacterium]|nr:hypothetical protein [Candidatus Limnocylindrales bacterium]
MDLKQIVMNDSERAAVDNGAQQRFTKRSQQINADYDQAFRLLTAPMLIRRPVPGFTQKLTELALEVMRTRILAYADAYVEAFTEAGMQVDLKAASAVQDFARICESVSLANLRSTPERLDKRAADLIAPWPMGLDQEFLRCRISAATEAVSRLRTVAPQGTPSASTAVRPAETRVTTSRWLKQKGNKICELRDECGWSVDELVQNSGIDKKSILDHLSNRSGMNPSTAKKYADAFSAKLGRRITVGDIASR